MIQDAAAKCRFCGEWLDPTKRPDWVQPAEASVAAAPAAAPAPTPSPAPTVAPTPAPVASAPAVVPPAVVPMGDPAPVMARSPRALADLDPAATTTDGSMHRPRRRETQTWSAPAWMADAEPQPTPRAKPAEPAEEVEAVPPEIDALLASDPEPEPEPTPAPARAAAPSIELLATPAPAPEPVEHTIDEVAERMKRIKASAAAVREAMLRESEILHPEVLGDDADDHHDGDDAAEAAVTMHAGAAPAVEVTPQPPPDVAAMLGDDFEDDLDDDDDDDDDLDDLDDDLGPPAAAPVAKAGKSSKRKSAALDGLDDDDDAMPAGGALAGFNFDDDDEDFDGDDEDFDGDFGDVGAARPIPWKPVAAGAAVVLVLGVGFFWNRIFPSETLEETPAGEEASKGEDEKAAPDGQVAQGSLAPPGQGQPVVPEGQPAAVGTPAADPAAVPADPAALADPAAVPPDPTAVPGAVPADPAAVPAAVPATPGAPLAGDALAALDEARGLYQKGGKKRLGEAKEKLQGILDASPNNADALLLMAQVELELGEMDASLETATKCTTVAPQTADCWLSIGVLKQNAKDDAAAVAAFERYLALAPEGAYASQVKKQLTRLQ